MLADSAVFVRLQRAELSRESLGGLRHPPGCSVFSVWVTVTLFFFIVFSVLFAFFRYFPLPVTAVTLISNKCIKEW